ncbi:MAG: patatin family protein [Acidobacteria bacterium]|nr:patatin family protein [Acidobacteriota bacterium]
MNIPPPDLHGCRAAEVRSLLRQRLRQGYRPGSSADGARLGVLVEGGGMRGLISAAALQALDCLGCADCFDEIYGTSAGALNGAYFLAGQIAMGASIYYVNLTGRHFIDFSRWPEVMDIHYLFDRWVSHGKQLDTARVVRSMTRLFITVTDTRTAQTIYFDAHDFDAGELVPMLRASAATPLFTSHREKIRGRYYNDGAVTAGLPLPKALERGCTHLLCLLTRPRGYRKRRQWWAAPYQWLRLRRYPTAYRQAFRERIVAYNRALDLLQSGTGTTATLIIAPAPDDFFIRNAETDPTRLHRAAAESFRRVVKVMEPDDDTLRFAPWPEAEAVASTAAERFFR